MYTGRNSWSTCLHQEVPSQTVMSLTVYILMGTWENGENPCYYITLSLFKHWTVKHQDLSFWQFSPLVKGCSIFENCKRCNNGTWGPRDDFFIKGQYCAECRPGWSGGDCLSKLFSHLYLPCHCFIHTQHIDERDRSVCSNSVNFCVSRKLKDIYKLCC